MDSQTIDNEWRKPTPNERKLVRRLLAVEFLGNSQLRAQMDAALVRKIDPDGSLSFQAHGAQRAAVRRRVPVEAFAQDEEGTPIHVLLHVKDGTLDELEIVKADGSRVRAMPPAGAFTVLAGMSDESSILMAESPEPAAAERRS